MYPTLQLKPALERRIRNVAHPWIFSGALAHSQAQLSQLHGQIVRVCVGERFLAVGVCNAHSQIAVRVFSWADEQLNFAFFQKRLEVALFSREQFVLDEKNTAARLVFAESDGLPGFVLDWYGGVMILQIHALAAEKLKDVFLDALRARYPGQCIYEVSDAQSRAKDGLPKEHVELHAGSLPDMLMIQEHGLSYLVNVHGQKTGFFIDQRVNRQLLEQYVHSMTRQKKVRVLNLFSYTGGFSMMAARGGAAEVTSVDVDQSALRQLDEQMTLNHLQTTHQEVCEDVFSYIEKIPTGAWDIVVLDPPAFVKAQKQKDQAIKGYLSLNQKVLETMVSGNLLFTFSCSGLVTEEDFIHMLNWAAHAAKKDVQILQILGHPLDHPLLPSFPEARYLKGLVVRIL